MVRLRHTRAVVDDFYAFGSVLVQANLWAGATWLSRQLHNGSPPSPMLVALASKAFSNNSLTMELRSTMTCLRRERPFPQPRPKAQNALLLSPSTQSLDVLGRDGLEQAAAIHSELQPSRSLRGRKQGL
jgi:hypothetical protein